MPDNRFIGVWKLISYELRSAGGEVTLPAGPKPVGRIAYDAEGHMSAQIMDPRRPRFRGERLKGGSVEEKAEAADGYIAYYGRYTVGDGAVIHHVEASLFPNWVGTDQMRHFEFSGNRLVLRASTTVGEARLVWERVNG